MAPTPNLTVALVRSQITFCIFHKAVKKTSLKSLFNLVRCKRDCRPPTPQQLGGVVSLPQSTCEWEKRKTIEVDVVEVISITSEF